jgi:hypothetical protein
MNVKPRQRFRVSNERGGILALMAVSLVVLLGVSALAVDLAMAFAARAEAQRVADSAALAGGSAYLDLQPDDPLLEPEVRARAYEYATMQTIREAAVDSPQVTVQVLTDSLKVRVWVTRDGLPTWFARILGIDEMDVGAMAAAQAVRAGSATCVKPFAVPDIWYEPPPDPTTEPPTEGDDTDGDKLWEDGEDWRLGDDMGERYKKYQGTYDPDATGYGSHLRNDASDATGRRYDGDWGRRIPIKVSDPQSDFQLAPGIFYPFRMPEDPNIEGCDGGDGATGDSGGAVYRNNICRCNANEIKLGEPYPTEPGDMIGPTFQGIRDLIALDPDASWNPDTGEVEGWDVTKYGTDWRSSPRVIKIALFDPIQLQKGGLQDLYFNNIALMFLEDQKNPRDPIIGRFLYFASGAGTGGPDDGSLVLYLRLVE